MRRLTRVVLALIVYALLWAACMAGLVTLPRSLATVVAFSPMWLLMSFACYSLAVVSWEMLHFRDCPEKVLAGVRFFFALSLLLRSRPGRTGGGAEAGN